MIGQVQVVVHHLTDDAVAVRAAYEESSARMAGTPGLLSNELHQGISDPRSFAVVSRWAGWPDFAAWESSPGHRDQTAPLRPFRDHTRPRPFEVFRVTARHGTPALTEAG
ncbi:antibiotic biosynthesis monooxygenase family protein [Micromonospora sp. DT44]|uniref:antibiotic biosynthesis monooxygenase family protein n=1 Tax=Micromonospora sp. DT44 TaxID=3393439 RepID=UPI003CF29C3F